MTGRGASNFLTRATAGLAAAFFATSLFLSLVGARSEGPRSVLESGKIQRTQARQARSRRPGDEPARYGPRQGAREEGRRAPRAAESPAVEVVVSESSGSDTCKRHAHAQPPAARQVELGHRRCRRFRPAAQPARRGCSSAHGQVHGDAEHRARADPVLARGAHAPDARARAAQAAAEARGRLQGRPLRRPRGGPARPHPQGPRQRAPRHGDRPRPWPARPGAACLPAPAGARTSMRWWRNSRLRASRSLRSRRAHGPGSSAAQASWSCS